MRRVCRAWCGARIVNLIPFSASTSSVSTSAAVSESHMPSGKRPKAIRNRVYPSDLRFLIASIRKRHDDVVVDLRDRDRRDRKTVPAVSLSASRIDGVYCRARFFHPGEQRRSEIEADPRVVVDDFGDAAFAVEHARRRIRRVTLRGDPLIPVVIRIGGVLQLDRLQPRIFTWRLVEVRRECRGNVPYLLLLRCEICRSDPCAPGINQGW